MTFSYPQKKLPSHRQKVKEQKERELDLDFDGDGLTEREERQYGLNPLSPDSDGVSAQYFGVNRSTMVWVK